MQLITCAVFTYLLCLFKIYIAVRIPDSINYRLLCWMAQRLKGVLSLFWFEVLIKASF